MGDSPSRPAGRYRRELDLLIVVYLTAIVFSILYPVSFFSPDNLRAILNNLAVDGILAVGMMLLMIAGVFDLSVGSMMSLAGVVTGWLLAKAGWPVAAAVAAGLGVAALGGLANGLLVARVRVNALIVTLATLGVFQGFAILIAGPSIANLPESFTRFGQTELPRRAAPGARDARPGRRSSTSCSRTRGSSASTTTSGATRRRPGCPGINVERLQVLGFTLMGLIAGAAGLCFAARVGASVSNAGVGAELRVITAVILGGASLTGGKGSIPGALIGVVFMALVNNVLIIARVSSYWQGIMVGVILVLAVALDSYRSRGRDVMTPTRRDLIALGAGLAGGAALARYAGQEGGRSAGGGGPRAARPGPGGRSTSGCRPTGRCRCSSPTTTRPWRSPGGNSGCG